MIPVSSKESLDRSTLVERLRDHLPKILAAYPGVQLAYLYGSAAEDMTTRFSDIDVGLVAEETIDPADHLNLALAIQNSLQDQVGIRNADVRIVSQYPLTFKGSVVSSGILVFSRNEGFRVEFETSTRDRYLEFEPVENGLLRALFPIVESGGAMLDPKKVLRLLQQQREYLKHLRTLSQTSLDEFLADPTKMGAAKYYFLVAIEICIDVGNHIIAAQRFRSPTDYADIFAILQENGVFSREFTATLREMVGFRNVLVHAYVDVDDRLVHENFRRLGDFEQFQRFVLQYIEKK